MEIEVRKTILCKFLENPSASGRSIAKSLKLPKSTVNDVLKKYKQSQSIERKPGTGRKPGLTKKELAPKILRSIKQNPGLSDADRAQKYGTSRWTVRRIRIKAGYKSYHAIKHPNRTDKQSLVAKNELVYSTGSS